MAPRKLSNKIRIAHADDEQLLLRSSAGDGWRRLRQPAGWRQRPWYLSRPRAIRGPWGAVAAGRGAGQAVTFSQGPRRRGGCTAAHAAGLLDLTVLPLADGRKRGFDQVGAGGQEGEKPQVRSSWKLLLVAPATKVPRWTPLSLCCGAGRRTEANSLPARGSRGSGTPPHPLSRPSRGGPAPRARGSASNATS